VGAVRCRGRTGHRLAGWLTAGALTAVVWVGQAGVPLATDAVQSAALIELSGPITPAMSRYVDQAISDAVSRRSPIIILQIDTPGGLDTSMRDIIKTMLSSPIPIVAYVAPPGARAASAGTYILYASHMAAMAPGTNLGAATPISIGGESPDESGAARPSPAAPSPSSPGATLQRPSGAPTAKSEKPEPTSVAAPASAGERKAVNDAVAYIRSLAQLRGRNADWGESAVRGAASLSAQDALAQHVIDLIANNPADLLRQIDGRTLRISGQEMVLHSSGLQIDRVGPNWRQRLLIVLTHPTLAYGLLLVGIYGLLLEGYNPGAVLPGVVGSLSLLLALYAFELLAVNFAGLALVTLGAGLIVLEFFMPAFGSLGIGGMAAFVFGSIILFDNSRLGLQTAIPLIAGLAVAGALLIAAITWLAVQARRRPVATGAEAMIGELVEVIEDAGDHWLVRYGGELWNAHASIALHPGQRARIVRISGLTLWLEPA
jgi:membrane-bound serine protease (ClpP class)